MSFEIKDLAGLSQPLTKLVEVVSSAVGAGFRPSAIRKEADARSYEIRALAQAAAEATEIQNDVRLQAHAKRIALIAAENPELATRAKQRLLIREVEGQLNIETIANHAALALPSQVSEEPIAADWRRKFFLEAENVCEADLQFLWGKVLAGEIVQPGSFGLRTLESLRNLSREDAELFRRACAVAMSDGWIALPGHDINSSLLPFEISFGQILELRDAGMLIAGDQLQKKFDVRDAVANQSKPQVLVNNGTLIELSSAAAPSINVPALIFTRAGRELQRLNDATPNDEYLRALGLHLRSLGFVAKRGMHTAMENGQSLITFETDL